MKSYFCLVVYVDSWSYVLYTQNQNAEIIGNYSLVFHDLTGQRWRTDPLDYTARCSTIVQALESLPNAVIRPSTVRCLQWLDYHSISSQVTIYCTLSELLVTSIIGLSIG